MAKKMVKSDKALGEAIVDLDFLKAAYTVGVGHTEGEWREFLAVLRAGKAIRKVL